MLNEHRLVMLVIKVPEGCLKKASDIDMREEALIYFKLKLICNHGYFEFGGGAKLISNSMCLSERTVKRYFKRLCDVGMMYKDDNGYGLVKYDRMYEILGFDMTPNKRKRRLGKFKIFKISVKHTDNLITAIAREEIALNQSRQEFMIKKKLTQTTNPDSTVSINSGVSLSCAGVGRLLGVSKSSGQRIEQALVKLYPNTVKIDRRVNVMPEGTKPGRGYYKEDGLLFKVMSNRILIH